MSMDVEAPFSNECRRGLGVGGDKAQGSWLAACSACPLPAQLWQSLTLQRARLAVGGFTATGLDPTKFTPEAAVCCYSLRKPKLGMLDPTAPPKSDPSSHFQLSCWEVTNDASGGLKAIMIWSQSMESKTTTNGTLCLLSTNGLTKDCLIH